MFKTEYAKNVYAELEKKNAGEKEFLQLQRKLLNQLKTTLQRILKCKNKRFLKDS